VNKIIRVTILTLSVLTVAPAQQETDNPGANRFAASVSELKGVCLVRDNKAAKPRRLKSDDKLQAGQGLQCEAKGYLKIRFRSNGVYKEIKTIDPKWYVIPNVPAATSKSGKLGGRPKAGRH
jgi:hypothetical protein